jgi:structure-specific endonuclease subunit SLX1
VLRLYNLSELIFLVHVTCDARLGSFFSEVSSWTNHCILLLRLLSSHNAWALANTRRWAWQNPHITTHISPESRLQHATQKKASGQPKRPHHSVTSVLSNLHLLLAVPSFSRWPLEVRFFSKDVYQSWLKWYSTVPPLCSSISIIQDFSPGPHGELETFASSENEHPKNDHDGPKKKRLKTGLGIAALDIDYAREKESVQKAREIVDFEREGTCNICHEALEHGQGLYTICPSSGCESVTHMTCLSRHFLKNHKSEEDKEILIPISGNCPSCKTPLRWIDVVKELSLRLRGQREVEKLLKVKRARKEKGNGSSEVLDLVDDEYEEEEDEEDLLRDLSKEMKRLREMNPTGEKMEGDTWHAVSSTDDDAEDDYNDHNSPAFTSSPPQYPHTAIPSSKSNAAAKAGPSRRVPKAAIEDRDWDDAELID